jgi:hypothetical protein
MRPLIIDDKIILQLNQLKDYAVDNPFDVEELELMMKGKAILVGKRPKHCVKFSFGYNVVFSIEEAKSGEWLRHISMSVPADDKLPNMQAVIEIMKLLSFEKEPKDNIVYTEDLSKKRQAINIIEVMTL